MQRLASARVILFGLGGVGSWCAESLVRTGLKHLTIVDFDCVSQSNINRQLPATSSTVGHPKTEIMYNRLKDINPEADIVAIREVYSKETSAQFHLEDYDYIIDCIDSLKDKIDLLVEASHVAGAKVYSSMGAALKIDPQRIRIADFWKVRGCPLGAAMRKRMHQRGMELGGPVTCVYSEEVMENREGDLNEIQVDGPVKKAQVNGSLAHITGVFGFTLTGLILQDIYNK